MAKERVQVAGPSPRRLAHWHRKTDEGVVGGVRDIIENVFVCLAIKLGDVASENVDVQFHGLFPAPLFGQNVFQGPLVASFDNFKVVAGCVQQPHQR
ncbi:hypothetical protein D3C72_1901340 [compost metagenome]